LAPWCHEPSRKSFRLITSRNVKYCQRVYLVTVKHLEESRAKYKDAAGEIEDWQTTVNTARGHNFEEVRSVYKDADNVDGCVIFDFRRNRCRLVTVIHYAKTAKKKKTQGHVLKPSFLTQKEYDKPKIRTRSTGGKNDRSTSSSQPSQGDLVVRYETERYPIPKASPVSVVRHLIEHGNLTQRDLIPQFGSESAVSVFLSGQRNLTVEQIRKLCARFKLSADFFIPRTVAAGVGGD
jgi:mRNA interferase HigB